MTTYEAIAARYSYRGDYQNTPVPRADLLKILEAGCAAPSGCNCQTTSFIAVDDPELMEKLFTVIRKGLGKTAPAMICVLTKKTIAYRDRSFTFRITAPPLKICSLPSLIWVTPAAGWKDTSPAENGSVTKWLPCWVCRRDMSWLPIFLWAFQWRKVPR